MVDSNKKNSLSKEEQEKCVQWVSDKWLKGKQICDICGATHWTVAQDLVTPLVIGSNNSLNIGSGNSYPAIMVICNNCGNTRFLNAVIAKILSPTNKGEKNGG